MKMPTIIFVYVCDREKDGTPIYAVANNLNEIPLDIGGEKVGCYKMCHEYTLNVEVKLK